MHLLTTALACGTFFVIADLVYAVDHYLVHHDRQRYRVTHGRHHRRYNGKKDAAQLDAYELSTYGSAAVMSIAITSVVSLMTGNPGFVLGAALKFVHTLLFHVYQHGWWGDVPLRQQSLGAPRRSWGIASAKYHAFHHSHPDDATFTYAESFAVFDRILELLHPHIVRFTVDGAAHVRRREAGREPVEQATGEPRPASSPGSWRAPQ
jgi:sterol desaturase/sphingolipid hydroxylase (fatty acid hydroxylase superfamily)